MAVYKIALIGDGGVGKTALRERYLGNGFKAEYLLTIGADFAMHDDKIEGIPVRYQIWDLAGQPRFEMVREAYYKGCVGALLVYDITRTESFYNTTKWINELWTYNGHGRVPIVVVANKIDMREYLDTTISFEQGMTFTRKLCKITQQDGFDCHFIETSAKAGTNVTKAFTILGKNVKNFIKQHRLVNPLIFLKTK